MAESDSRPVRPPKPKKEEYTMRLEPLNGYVLKEETIRKIMGDGAAKRARPTTMPPDARPEKQKKKPKPAKPGYREKQRAKVLNDELGTYIAMQSELFREHDWEEFVRIVRQRGDLLEPKGMAAEHPGAQFLQHLARYGAPAITTTAPWSEAELEYRLKRGSHKSCDEHLEFLRGEMLEFVQKHFWTVLPYRLLKERLRDKIAELKHLRVSPMGIIPQRGRWP